MIIFFDIDGVLNNQKTLSKNYKKFGTNFLDSSNLRNLQRLVEQIPLVDLLCVLVGEKQTNMKNSKKH